MQATAWTLTEFGATVLSLAVKRGIRQNVELARLLTEHGEKTSGEKISHWLHGINAAPPHVPRTLITALGLDADEVNLLVHAYALGQDVRIQPVPNRSQTLISDAS